MIIRSPVISLLISAFLLQSVLCAETASKAFTDAELFEIYTDYLRKKTDRKTVKYVLFLNLDREPIGPTRAYLKSIDRRRLRVGARKRKEEGIHSMELSVLMREDSEGYEMWVTNQAGWCVALWNYPISKGETGWEISDRKRTVRAR